MKGCLSALVILASCLLATPGPLSAHHGGAAYDMGKLTTLKGTVTDFQFMNPHSEIFLDVKDDSGKVEKWIAEFASRTSMVRSGWTQNSLKPGDQITVVGNRSKNGSTTMRLRSIVMPDGHEIKMNRGEDYAN